MSSAMTSVECPFLPSLPSQSRKDSLPKTMTVLPFCSHSLAVFAVWPKHKHSYQSVTLLSSLPRFTATENFTPSDFPLRPSKLNTSGSLPRLPINCTFANPISYPLSAPVGAFYSFCVPARRTGPRQWIAILSGDGISIRLDQILAGARRCLCMTRTLFAGGRQLLELSLFIDDEPANYDCCELVPEHLRFRQEGRALGFLAGVELLAGHEGQVLLDGAERLVGGREADVRRLWRSVAVGGGSGGFGHRLPFKHPFCGLQEDFRRWFDWPGRPKPSLLLLGRRPCRQRFPPGVGSLWGAAAWHSKPAFGAALASRS